MDEAYWRPPETLKVNSLIVEKYYLPLLAVDKEAVRDYILIHKKLGFCSCIGNYKNIRRFRRLPQIKIKWFLKICENLWINQVFVL